MALPSHAKRKVRNPQNPPFFRERVNLRREGEQHKMERDYVSKDEQTVVFKQLRARAGNNVRAFL